MSAPVYATHICRTCTSKFTALLGSADLCPTCVPYPHLVTP